MQDTLLITGGAGFIGSKLVLTLVKGGQRVVTLDALTYAGNRANLAPLDGDPNHTFVHGSINDFALVAELLKRHQPRAILHLAAESHVDRSIEAPAAFIETNVVGTHTLLRAALGYWQALPAASQARFRFLHVSTDEVYGSLAPGEESTESSPYLPNSPYAASKAASDHLARAYHHTYGLPVLMTHASNNYGPYQFPEKLIPLLILRAVKGEPMPVYGDGLNERDWLHVSDHVAALTRVLEAGVPGETYNVGAGNSISNLTVVEALCAGLDALVPAGAPHARLRTFVTDRLGHDRRYALAVAKIRRELGWQPKVQFAEGIRQTVAWYVKQF